MSTVSSVSQIADTSKLLALLVARNPSADAAVREALVAMEANQAALQEAMINMASGTRLDVVA